MRTDRAEWFKFYGVTPSDRDPVNPLTPVAIFTGQILLECFRKAEIDRLNFLQKHLEKNPGQPSPYSDRLKRENWAMFVRACFLLGAEPGQYENLHQHELFA